VPPRTFERERAREVARWFARPGEGERVLRPRTNIYFVVVVVLVLVLVLVDGYDVLICTVPTYFSSRFLMIGAAHWMNEWIDM